MVIVFYYVRDFFLFIGGILVFVFDLIMSIVDLLVACASFLGNLLLSLPTVVQVGGSALIIVCVLYKILGRESQS